jgi:hypothetical protein
MVLTDGVCPEGTLIDHGPVELYRPGTAFSEPISIPLNLCEFG